MISLILFLVLAMFNMPAALCLLALRVAAYLARRSQEPKRYRPTTIQQRAFDERLLEHIAAVRREGTS